MSAAMKNNLDINGIKIDNSEYLLSQYADDSTLTLDDDEKSLEQSLYILEKFSECSGLRANLEKTEAIWIGSKAHSKEIFHQGERLNWNQTGKFKLLGINYDLFAVDKTAYNFKEKIEKINSLLNTWIYQDLTYLGKITVIKSLALPILIQSLTILPNPSFENFKKIENIFFKFLWNGKPDKIKRNVLIGSYDTGGLKMPHIESFCYSLKMTWIYKLLDPFNLSPWKILFNDKYRKYGADKIWMMNKDSIEQISIYFNRFWKDILLNWAKLRNASHDHNDLMGQPIWFNKLLKIDNKTIFYEKWCEAGIFFVNDLLNENNEFLSFNQFKETYDIDTNFLQFYGIYHMIPSSWKDQIKNCEKKINITCDNLDFLKTNQKSCPYFYKLFLATYHKNPTKSQNKWKEILHMEIAHWDLFYMHPFKCSLSNKMIIFQYKILQRTLSTNNLLYKCKLKETQLCSFCNETKETIEHIFWECYIVKNFWFQLVDTLHSNCNYELLISKQNILLGSDIIDISGNFFTVLMKYYIYSCRLNSLLPCVKIALKKLKNYYIVEKLSSTFHSSPAIGEKIEKKWEPFQQLIL